MIDSLSSPQDNPMSSNDAEISRYRKIMTIFFTLTLKFVDVIFLLNHLYATEQFIFNVFQSTNL
jgi:hypothetical protein